MIENVKRLNPELQRLRFRKPQILKQRHIVVIQPRPAKKSPPRSPRRSQRVLAKLRSFEIRLPVPRIVIQIERPTRIIRLINAKIINPIRLRAQQGIIPKINQRHRKPGTHASDPRNLPTLSPTIRSAEKLLK